MKVNGKMTKYEGFEPELEANIQKMTKYQEAKKNNLLKSTSKKWAHNRG